MIFKNLNLLPLTGLMFLMSSCVTNKGFVKNFTIESKLGKEPGSEVFVIKKNGEKIEGQKLTYSPFSIWKVRQKENWIAVDGQKIDDDEYEIFQTQEAYKQLYKPEKSVYPRPFFINRLRFGKINLYYYEHEALNHGKDVRGDYPCMFLKKKKET